MLQVSAGILSAREREIDRFVRGYLIESHGLVLSAVDASTNRPFEKKVFGANVDRMRHPNALAAEDFGSYLAYENCGMATSGWLASQVCRYNLTGDAEALQSARGAARALLDLYARSQQVAPGFFSKFHEGKLSPEISTDQCLYAIWALDRYAPLASVQERGEIARMAGGMARFWRDRNYRHPYRERDYDWQWPLNRFPPLLWLAWVHTQEKEFLDEYSRLVALPEVREVPPFAMSTRAQWRAGCHGNPSHWPFRLGNAGQGGISLEPLLVLDAPPRHLWLEQLEELIESTLPDLRDDGLGRGHFHYNEETGEAVEVDQPRHASGQPNPVWEAKYYISAARTGSLSCLYARVLMAAERHLPGRGYAQKGLRILELVGLPLMLEKIDHAGHLPENQRWLTRWLSGDAVVNWLWAYWLARADRLA